MNHLKDMIESELKSIGLNYEYIQDDNLFLFNMTMDNSVGTLKVIIHIFPDSYVVYAILNNRGSSKKASRVSDFLHRANRGMLNGNFEYDHVHGRIRFKLFVNAKDINAIAGTFYEADSKEYNAFIEANNYAITSIETESFEVVMDCDFQTH